METRPPASPTRRRWPYVAAAGVLLASGAIYFALQSSTSDATDADITPSAPTTRAHKSIDDEPQPEAEQDDVDAGPHALAVKVLFENKPVQNARVRLVPLDAAHGAIAPNCACAPDQPDGGDADDEPTDSPEGVGALDGSCELCDPSIDALFEIAQRGASFLAEAETTTDADGIARFTTFAEEPAVWVEARGFRPASVLPQSENPDDPDEVTLVRDGNTKISVHDEEGRPLDAAELAIFSETPFSPLTRVLHGANQLVRSLPDEVDLVVVARAAGYLPAQVNVRDPEEDVEVQLEKPHKVRGRVLHNDVPVAGADVTLSGGTRDVTLHAISSRDGRFDFDGVPSGSFELHGEKGTLRGSQDIEVGDDDSELALLLTDSAKVEGTITDAATGEPLADASIELTGEDEGFATADTDETGHFEVDATPGQYQLRASHEEHLTAERQLSLAEGQTVHLDLALQGGGQIAGEVVDGHGQPVAEARVILEVADNRELGDSRRVANTNEKGQFKLKGLHDGAHVVSVEADGHPTLVQPLQLPADSLRLQLTDGASIDGTVLGPTGPIEGAQVEIAADHRSGGVNSAETDKDGHFHVAGLAAGKATVVAVATGLAASEPTALDMHEGDVARVELHLASGLEIHGRVEDDTGKPIPEAMVEGYAEGGGGRAPLPGRNSSSTSDSEGNFVLSGLHAGNYRVFAYHEGMAQGTPQATTAGSRGVTIQLQRSGKLTGRVVTRGGAPVHRFSVEGEEFRSADGSFTVKEVSPDTTEIFVEGSFPTVRVPVTPSGGDIVNLGVITVDDGEPLSGSVVNADGHPVPGVQVTELPPGYGSDEPAGDDSSASDLDLDGPHTVTTDAAGHFTFGHLRHGSYLVQASSAAGSSGSVRAMSGTSDLQLVLQSGATVHGEATLPDGTPLPEGMAVFVAGAITAQARVASGVFALQGLPAGKAQLLVTGFGPGGMRVTGVQEVSLAAGQESDVRVVAGPPNPLTNPIPE